MRFDLTNKNTEELLERQQLLSEEIPAEIREAMTVEEIEERGDELNAIKAELEARRAAAAEEARKAEEAAQMSGKKIINTEVKSMNYEVSSPEYRDAFLRNLQGKELNAEERAAVTATAAIPTQTMNQIVGKLELNPLIAAVDVTNIPGYVTYPAEGTINDAAWVAMGTAANDSADTLQAVTLGA